MTKLSWDKVGDRRFETGVDRGILYPSEELIIPWNGLISVNEKVSGGESTPYWFDGIKYLDVVGNEDYQATLVAYTYPEEFEACDGSLEVQQGVIATLQPRKTFNLCYRTKIGNDVDGLDYGYKIHLVYNATASPSEKAYNTLASDISALNFQWDINAVPLPSSTFKPTAHFIIDSSRFTYPTFDDVEALIYGTNETDPVFPTLDLILPILSGGLIEEPIELTF